MTVYIAARDINGKSLRAQAGLPLPERFQYKHVAVQLLKELGEDAIFELNPDSEKYRVVEASVVAELEKEVSILRVENEQLTMRVLELEESIDKARVLVDKSAAKGLSHRTR